MIRKLIPILLGFLLINSISMAQLKTMSKNGTDIKLYVDLSSFNIQGISNNAMTSIVRQALSIWMSGFNVENVTSVTDGTENITIKITNSSGLGGFGNTPNEAIDDDFAIIEIATDPKSGLSTLKSGWELTTSACYSYNQEENKSMKGLKQTILHEMGHVLGLFGYHLTDANILMNIIEGPASNGTSDLTQTSYITVTDRNKLISLGYTITPPTSLQYFKNEYNGSSISGSFIWENSGSDINFLSKISSGSSVFIPIGNQYVAQPEFDKYIVSADETQHRIWRGEATVDFQKKFIVPSETNTHFADFTKLQTVTLAASNEAGTGGTVALKDPWYLPSGQTIRTGTDFRSATSSGNSEKVFLNQAYDANKPNSYYQLSAFQNQQINGFQSTFLGWSGSGASVTNPTAGQTPVIFNANNATVTANYKAHLASKQSGWVQSTSVEYNFNGKQSVLYKSDGHLWLHSENPDGSNPTEKKIADASENPHDYSVVQTLSSYDDLYTIYCYVNGSNQIVVRSSGSGPYINKTFTETFPANVKPKIMVGSLVVSGQPPYSRLVVWYQDGTAIKHQYYTLSTNSWETTVWSSYNLGSSASGATVQMATNGTFGYLFWKNGYSLYSCQFETGFSSIYTVANQS